MSSAKPLSAIARAIAGDDEVIVIVRMKEVAPHTLVVTVGSSIDVANHYNDRILSEGIQALAAGRPAIARYRE